MFSGLVNIGGRHLYAEVAGAGGPTVLLEAGASQTSSTWDSVWSELQAVATVLRYDRANLGQSNPAPTPRTAEEIVADLYALVKRLELPAPYILVGHSFGGLCMQLFAQRYLGEVAGLVLVDSSHADQTARGLAVLGERPDEPEVVRNLRQWFANPDTVSPEGVQMAKSLAQVRAGGLLGDLLLVVLARSTAVVWPGFPPAISVGMEESWQEMQADLVRLSTAGRLVVAEQSGHYIQRDEPELVVGEILALVRCCSGVQSDLC